MSAPTLDKCSAAIAEVREDVMVSGIDRQTVNLALGRIFRLASRPERDGDLAQYEKCRAIILGICGDDLRGEIPWSEPYSGFNFGHGASGCVE